MLNAEWGAAATTVGKSLRVVRFASIITRNASHHSPFIIHHSQFIIPQC